MVTSLHPRPSVSSVVERNELSVLRFLRCPLLVLTGANRENGDHAFFKQDPFRFRVFRVFRGGKTGKSSCVMTLDAGRIQQHPRAGVLPDPTVERGTAKSEKSGQEPI